MKKSPAITLIGCLACGVLVMLCSFAPAEAEGDAAVAQAATVTTGAPAAAENSAENAQKARVDAIRAMSKKERLAYFKDLPQAERRALWFDMHRTQASARGQEPPTKGAGGTYRSKTSETTRRGAGPISYDDGLERVSGKAAAPSARALGSIVYDDGSGTVTFGGGAIIGNRFSSADGNPLLASGTVDSVVAVVAQGPAFTSNSAGFVLLGPQTGGGGAFAIFSTFTAGVTATTETVTFTGIGAAYTGSSFFVLFGDFANVYDPIFDTGTNAGQGHHGVVGYTGGMGPNITSTFDFGGSLNSLVRATGNILPVELLSFEVK